MAIAEIFQTSARKPHAHKDLYHCFKRDSFCTDAHNDTNGYNDNNKYIDSYNTKKINVALQIYTFIQENLVSITDHKGHKDFL